MQSHLQLHVRDGGVEDPKDPKGHMNTRRSKELIIGLCGAMGSGVTTVIKDISDSLAIFGYTTHTIKISRFIEGAIDIKPYYDNSTYLEKPKSKRINALQDGGNELRARYGQDVLSQFAIRDIVLVRDKIRAQMTEGQGVVPQEEDDISSEYKLAFILDSLKHPAEVQLLRMVYGNMFYLIGVLSAESLRHDRLIDGKDMSGSDAMFLMERDKAESAEHGQQLIKTLQHADLFVRNNSVNMKQLGETVERFLNLIHGKPAITPSIDETAMYMAQSAGLKSACLSRQVGVAIIRRNGEVIATGCNDVPKKGGLYTFEDGKFDMRCKELPRGICFNDKYKNEIRQEMKHIIIDNLTRLGFATGRTLEQTAESIVDNIHKKTRIKDLLEFSRSIHAEMDAIISAARIGGVSLNDCILYSTTFPCHICARHIIAAGIAKVYYIEPYEKSLAKELHGDAIFLEPNDDQENNKKVHFLHFEGVAPRQYLNLFFAREDRKKDGRMVETNLAESIPVVVSFLDSYREYELKIVDILTAQVPSAKVITIPEGPEPQNAS